MSRPLGVIEEWLQQGLDYGAMMLSEEPRFYQLDLEAEGGGADFLSQFAGQVIYTQDGQSWRIEAIPSGSITTYRLINTQTDQRLTGNQMRGLTFVDNLGVGHTIGTVSGGDYPLSSRSLSESALARFFGTGDGGTAATGRTQFASERALQEAQAQELRDRLELDRQRLQADIDATEQRMDEIRLEAKLAFEREDALLTRRLEAEMAMLELRLENSRKELLFGEIGASTRTVFQAQEAERGRQQEMAGKDPFRFTGTLRGRGTTGQTPIDVFKQQGQQFVNQQLPTFSIDDPIPVLEAGLQGLQKMAVSGAPQGLIPGFAKGGVIEMEHKDGAFTMRPQRTARLVGEEGPEIMVTDPERNEVEIIPLSRGAQQGGTFDFGDLSLGGFPDLLASLRRGTGLRPSSLTDPGRGGFGTVSTGRILGKERAAALGAFQIAPGTPVKVPWSDKIFIIDEQGRYRQFGGPESFRESGFTGADVRTVEQKELRRLERGPRLEEGFSLPLPNFERTFGALGQPLSTRQGFLELAAVNPDFSTQDAMELANRIGFLPAPHKIARDFPLLDPAEQQGILSLYELAGFPAASFQRAIQAATPRGAFSRPQRIGFTGARI